MLQQPVQNGTKVINNNLHETDQQVLQNEQAQILRYQKDKSWSKGKPDQDASQNWQNNS